MFESDNFDLNLLINLNRSSNQTRCRNLIDTNAILFLLIQIYKTAVYASLLLFVDKVIQNESDINDKRSHHRNS